MIRGTKLSAVMLLVACRAVAPPASLGLSRVRDSAGVTIVTSDAPNVVASVQVANEPAVVVHGSDSLVLLRVVSAGRLADGRLAILNGREPGIFLAGTDGQILRRIGRLGGGPGEFRAPQVLSVQGESLMVWDINYGPRTVFDTSGRVLGVHSFDLATLQSVFGDSATSERHLPVGTDGIVAVTRVVGESPGARATTGMWRQQGSLIFIPESGPPRPIGSSPGLVMYNVRHGLETVAVTPLLFVGASSAVDQERQLVYIGDGLRRVIDVHRLDGSLLRSIRWGGAGERATDEEFARMSALWLQQADARFGTRSGRQLLRQLPDQHEFPPVLAIVPGKDGRLWVRAGIRQWNVFSAEGEWIVHVNLPFRTLFEAGEDYLLGLIVDDDGVESVAVLPLRTK